MATTPAAEIRPIGGLNNNLVNPKLDGTPGSPELRIAAPNFAPGTKDGLVDGPNPRTISNVVSAASDGGPQDVNGASAWQYVFGQFVDHDLDLEVQGGSAIDITVPAGDPTIDQDTIPLNRALTNSVTGTVANTVTPYLDISQVYGSDATTAASLRNSDGTMKTSDGDALPIVNGQFVAGDVRVMENPELIAVTTLFVREHNRIVAELKAANPLLTGDQLYEQARQINTAQYENIVYSEFLPSDIGPHAIPRYTGYKPGVNPQVTQEFTAGAFRVGHSQVSDEQAGVDNMGVHTFDQPLSEAFANTPAQDVANGIDDLLRHLSSDVSQGTDVLAVDSLRNLLMAPPNFTDLIATDIQRERDLGLGTLNQTRVALGLKPYTSFAQLTHDTTVQDNLKSVYGSIDKVDLFIGGLAENHAPGADVGQTFQAIIADQFTRIRDGDRFFWQNQITDPAERAAIQSTTLGDIISRNTDTPVLQDNVFVAQDRHPSDAPPENPLRPQMVMGINDDGAEIVGGPAADTIVAGDGNDQVLAGNGGGDTFVFQFADHNYTVADFMPGSDNLKFLLPGSAIITQALNGDAVVTESGSAVTLTGVAPITLVQSQSSISAPGGLHLDISNA